MKRLFGVVRHLLPWFSLVLGVTSALWMNRRPERAWLIASAAGAGWLVLGAAAILQGIDPKRLARHRKLVHHAARFSMRAAAQSLVQLCIFFSVPFFVRASSVTGHYVFDALLITVGALTLWDPLYSAILDRPPLGAVLQAIAAFAGLDCVLPVLGLSNRMSLAIAALTAAIGLPFAAAMAAPPESRRRHTIVALCLGIWIPLGLAFGGTRFIPPAPLRLAAGMIGTKIQDRTVLDPTTELSTVPNQLVCFTAIDAPRGLRDKLRHAWHHDHTRFAPLELEVRGGRDQGFRTWSYKHNLKPGKWTCTIETESGQLLGQLTVLIGN
jgi:hypothetical protein